MDRDIKYPETTVETLPPYEQRHYDLAYSIIVSSLRKSGVDTWPALRAAMATELALAEKRGEAKAREAQEKNWD
jgi:hypothetical protein